MSKQQASIAKRAGQKKPRLTKVFDKAGSGKKKQTPSSLDGKKGKVAQDGAELNEAFSFDFGDLEENAGKIKAVEIVVPVRTEKLNERMAAMARKINFMAQESDDDGVDEMAEDASEEDEVCHDLEAEVDVDADADVGDDADAEEVNDTQVPLLPGAEASVCVPSEEEASRMSFEDFGLSRALLKALAAGGFVRPTRIQAAAIRAILSGRDVLGGAQTGSGKTLAFLLPVLERLQYRPRTGAATRVLVLLPTRELAVQCYAVCEQLARFTDITMALAAGGLPLRPQEAALRRRPDVVVATPGRLIDHLTNTPQFSLDTVDILVLDEADRMLAEGFADELERILAACPSAGQRQTLLFSASLGEGNGDSEQLRDLARLSLARPLQIMADRQGALASALSQEFVRVRQGRDTENDRLALLLALAVRTVGREPCIVFMPTRDLCHRFRLLLGLAGQHAVELQGGLAQEERLASLAAFQRGEVTFLVATDVAARGLDIRGVRWVLNYAMPPTYAQYLHRVGRTARAGKAGKAVTLVGEADRRTLKLVLKGSPSALPPLQRVIDPEVAAAYGRRLTDELLPALRVLLADEATEKALDSADAEVQRATNLIKHADEIGARPPRQWFQTGREKAASRRKDGAVSSAKGNADKRKGKKASKTL